MKYQFAVTNARRLILCLTILSFACSCFEPQFQASTSTALSPDGDTIKDISVTFLTDDDDKDANTVVSVRIRRADGETVAVAKDAFGYFGVNSKEGPYKLSASGVLSQREFSSGNISISIYPVGHDTWKFDCYLDFTYSGGKRGQKVFEGVVLSENPKERTRTFALY